MKFLDLILVFLTALGFAYLAVPLLLRFAHSNEIYDLPDHMQPNRRRMHIKPIPRLGGIAIIGAFFFALIIWKVPLHSKIIYLCSIVLFCVGLIDDLKNLSAKLRLCIQFCVASFTVYFANLSIKSISISPDIILFIPPLMGFFLATFIIIGAINSMNMIDGLDGLASGVLLISLSILSYFLFLNSGKHELLLLFTVPMLGTLIGFLKYNTHPSTIFMGDSGSNWLGFMVGSFILIVANTSPTIPFMSILLAFSIPIFDTAHVILLRLVQGRNPMSADNLHFHHSLIRIGFSHSQSVGVIYFLMFFFGILGMIPVALPSYPLWWISWIGALLLIGLLIISVQLKKDLISNFFIFKKTQNTTQTLGYPLHAFIFCIESLHRYTIYALLFLTPWIIVPDLTLVNVSASIACMVMGVILFLKKTCSFLSACFLVFITSVLFSTSNVDSINVELFTLNFNLQTVFNLIFLWLFLCTIFFCAMTLRRKFFTITPTDILLVLIPLLLLMMPDTWHHEYGLRIMVIRSLVLFSALRLFGKNTIHPSY